MTSNTVASLGVPFDADDVEGFRAGQSITLTGVVYTARDAAHERFARAIAAGEPLPFDPAGQVIYFVGPTPARPGHAIGSAGPTTASRMDPYSPLLIERGLVGMIGKGRRSAEVKESMLRHRCIYFGAVEGMAALLARRVAKSEVVGYSDLGTEAVRRLEIKDFPVLLVNDLHGGDLYTDGPLRWRQPSRL